MMLRPTESRILFLQQLGRGLRLSPEKQRLTVIDYIGNHRAFLLKPRALLGLTDSDVDLVATLEKIRNGSLHLPPGCSVTYDLAALDLLSALIRTRSGDDLFKSYYVDFRARYEARPTASEAYHDGYAPRALRPNYGSWLRFVENMGDLDQMELAAVAQTQPFLDVESTPMTKGFKMLVLMAMLNENVFPGQISISDLVRSVSRLASRSAIWKRDFDVPIEDESAVKDVLERNPIAAWTGGRGTRDRSYFKYEEGLFSSLIVVDASCRESFQGLVRELVDWRLAEYLRRTDSEQLGEGFVAKVSHSGGRPILFLPSRKQERQIPTGETPLLVDGERMIASFVKIAINVVRRPDSTENRLPAILQGWFGPDAGLSGTSHEVQFSMNEENHTWSMEPSRRSQTRVTPTIWHPYMRENIPSLFGFTFTTAIWNVGFVKLPGHVFLLVTLEKNALDSEFRYEDRFTSAELFQWQSQNRTVQGSAHGRVIRDHAELGYEVHLFVRRCKRANGGGAAPFTYCGDVDFVSWSGDAPITVLWRLRNPLPQSVADSLQTENGNLAKA